MAKLRLRNKRRLGRPPRWHFPRFVERRYLEYLRREVVDRLRKSVQSEVLPRLKMLKLQVDRGRPTPETVRVDALEDDILAMSRALEQGLDAGPSAQFETRSTLQDLGSEISTLNRQQWKHIIRQTIGVELLQQEPYLATQQSLFVSQNVQLITKMKQESVADIQGIVERGLQQGLRVEEIAEQVERRVGVTEARAKLIARDQVAKANAELTELRQTNIGVSKYVWSTSEDERVRPSHKALNGRMCRWDDPTLYSDDGGETWKQRSSINAVQLHPGQDFQCRCVSSPVLEDLL